MVETSFRCLHAKKYETKEVFDNTRVRFMLQGLMMHVLDCHMSLLCTVSVYVQHNVFCY